MRVFTLYTVICEVKMADGSVEPLTVEKLDARWLENLMFAQPSNFEKCVDFIRNTDLKATYPILYGITGDLCYNDIQVMRENYDNLGYDEKLVIAIWKLRGLQMAC